MHYYEVIKLKKQKHLLPSLSLTRTKIPLTIIIKRPTNDTTSNTPPQKSH